MLLSLLQDCHGFQAPRWCHSARFVASSEFAGDDRRIQIPLDPWVRPEMTLMAGQLWLCESSHSVLRQPLEPCLRPAR